jgi:Protein of unknown function (DUF4235)
MAEDGRVEAVFLTVVGLAAAAAAKKAIDVVWVAATGRRTPQPDDPDETLPRAAAAAVVTGAVVSLVRMGISRKAHQVQRSRRAQA